MQLTLEQIQSAVQVWLSFNEKSFKFNENIHCFYLNLKPNLNIVFYHTL